MAGTNPTDDLKDKASPDQVTNASAPPSPPQTSPAPKVDESAVPTGTELTGELVGVNELAVADGVGIDTATALASRTAWDSDELDPNKRHSIASGKSNEHIKLPEQDGYGTY